MPYGRIDTRSRRRRFPHLGTSLRNIKSLGHIAQTRHVSALSDLSIRHYEFLQLTLLLT